MTSAEAAEALHMSKRGAIAMLRRKGVEESKAHNPRGSDHSLLLFNRETVEEMKRRVVWNKRALVSIEERPGYAFDFVTFTAAEGQVKAMVGKHKGLKDGGHVHFYIMLEDEES